MDFNPQQQEFLKHYLNPKDKYFGNALQSALSAGYSQEYSETITSQMPDWLANALGKSKRVAHAENNLDLALNGLLDDPEKGKKDIQWKATEFTLERLRKEEYSARQELTGADGKDLQPLLVKFISDDDNTNEKE